MHTYDNCVRPVPKDNPLFRHTCALGSCISRPRSVSCQRRICHSSVRPTGLYNPRGHHIASLSEYTALHRIENRRDTLEKRKCTCVTKHTRSALVVTAAKTATTVKKITPHLRDCGCLRPPQRYRKRICDNTRLMTDGCSDVVMKET